LYSATCEKVWFDDFRIFQTILTWSRCRTSRWEEDCSAKPGRSGSHPYRGDTSAYQRIIYGRGDCSSEAAQARTNPQRCAGEEGDLHRDKVRPKHIGSYWLTVVSESSLTSTMSACRNKYSRQDPLRRWKERNSSTSCSIIVRRVVLDSSFSIPYGFVDVASQVYSSPTV